MLMTNQMDDSERLGQGGLIQRRGMLESGLSTLSASSLLIKNTHLVKTQDPKDVKRHVGRSVEDDNNRCFVLYMLR